MAIHRSASERLENEYFCQAMPQFTSKCTQLAMQIERQSEYRCDDGVVSCLQGLSLGYPNAPSPRLSEIPFEIVACGLLRGKLPQAFDVARIGGILMAREAGTVGR